MIAETANCLMLLRLDVCFAAALARAKTGKRIAARIAMIAITTKSSMSVNALRQIERMESPSSHSCEDWDHFNATSLRLMGDGVVARSSGRDDLPPFLQR